MTEPKGLYGYDLFGDEIKPPSRGAISDRFVASPFSILNAREGWWQKRKRMWLAYGIRGEQGRNALPDGPGAAASKSSCYLIKKSDGTSATSGEMYGGDDHNGSSVFDPVLCELVYRWFCPADGQVVDPFAGGSVRGIVAGMLGLDYWGCDLSAEQIEANRQQAKDIAPDAPIRWLTGDALDMVPEAPQADLMFSCPPYGNLEQYSNDPADLSNMDYHAFIGAYKRIIMRACERLKPNRFACFVVGEFRNKKTGLYRGFVADTIKAFQEQGLPLYNEAILVTPCGTAPMRATIQFNGGRKLVKTHQNVLVFVKGDPKKASDACTMEQP